VGIVVVVGRDPTLLVDGGDDDVMPVDFVVDETVEMLLATLVVLVAIFNDDLFIRKIR
jgi:hypothetical protein